jgi:hypothetical protein
MQQKFMIRAENPRSPFDFVVVPDDDDKTLAAVIMQYFPKYNNYNRKGSSFSFFHGKKEFGYHLMKIFTEKGKNYTQKGEEYIQIEI